MKFRHHQKFKRRIKILSPYLKKTRETYSHFEQVSLRSEVPLTHPPLTTSPLRKFTELVLPKRDSGFIGVMEKPRGVVLGRDTSKKTQQIKQTTGPPSPVMKGQTTHKKVGSTFTSYSPLMKES